MENRYPRIRTSILFDEKAMKLCSRFAQTKLLTGEPFVQVRGGFFLSQFQSSFGCLPTDLDAARLASCQHRTRILGTHQTGARGDDLATAHLSIGHIRLIRPCVNREVSLLPIITTSSTIHGCPSQFPPLRGIGLMTHGTKRHLPAPRGVQTLLPHPPWLHPAHGPFTCLRPNYLNLFHRNSFTINHHRRFRAAGALLYFPQIPS